MPADVIDDVPIMETPDAGDRFIIKSMRRIRFASAY